jgi:hypothetical protein
MCEARHSAFPMSESGKNNRKGIVSLVNIITPFHKYIIKSISSEEIGRIEKVSFAHGGKDGVPYPVARKTYDKSISYLYSAIEGAEIEREQKIGAQKLAEYSARMFNED